MSPFAALVERNNGVFGGCWCMGFHAEGAGKDTAVFERGPREAVEVPTDNDDLCRSSLSCSAPKGAQQVDSDRRPLLGDSDGEVVDDSGRAAGVVNRRRGDDRADSEAGECSSGVRDDGDDRVVLRKTGWYSAY